MRTLSMVLICVLVVAGGFGAGGQAAATPKQAIKDLGKAVMDGDADGFVACFHVTPKDKPMLKAMGGFIAAMVGYQKAFIAAYGKEKWAAMQSGNSPTKMLSDFDQSKLDNVEIKEDGDTATATMPGEKRPMKLIRVNGRWRIDATGMLKDAPANREQALKMMAAMTSAIDGAKAKVGAAGVSAEDAQKALMAAFMKAAMEAMGGANMPPPPR